jgi:hypothetical protein
MRRGTLIAILLLAVLLAIAAYAQYEIGQRGPPSPSPSPSASTTRSSAAAPTAAVSPAG